MWKRNNNHFHLTEPFWGLNQNSSSQSVIASKGGLGPPVVPAVLSRVLQDQNYFHNYAKTYLTFSLSFYSNTKLLNAFSFLLFHKCTVEFLRGHLTCYLSRLNAEDGRIQISSIKPDTEEIYRNVNKITSHVFCFEKYVLFHMEVFMLTFYHNSHQRFMIYFNHYFKWIHNYFEIFSALISSITNIDKWDP